MNLANVAIVDDSGGVDVWKIAKSAVSRHLSRTRIARYKYWSRFSQCMLVLTSAWSRYTHTSTGTFKHPTTSHLRCKEGRTHRPLHCKLKQLLAIRWIAYACSPAQPVRLTRRAKNRSQRHVLLTIAPSITLKFAVSKMGLPWPKCKITCEPMHILPYLSGRPTHPCWRIPFA